MKPIAAAESIDLRDAVGRFAFDAIKAPLDLPPFPCSAMDGYALDVANLKGRTAPYRLKISGQSLAGHSYNAPLDPTSCIRITTGACVPDGANAVLIQENCTIDSDHINFSFKPAAGDNIRTAGSDVKLGGSLISKGQRLNPFTISWLAACGLTSLNVHARPRIAVFSTGDELVEPGHTLGAGQIFDANRLALIELMRPLPVQIEDLGILPDEPAVIRSRLVSASEQNDLLLTSGGVSVGDADYVRAVVEEIGRIDLWRLNLKPGKPLAFGHIADCLFIGLPGNPVSSIVTYLLITRPVLVALAGGESQEPSRFNAILEHGIKHQPGREEYQRGCLKFSSNVPSVAITGDQSSNRLSTFNRADCLVRIPQQSGDLSRGAEVEVLPLFGMVS